MRFKALPALQLRLSFAVAFLLAPAPGHAAVLVDAIVASVDGKAIALSDINAERAGQATLTLGEFQHDADAQALLDRLILERLIRSEADQRRLQVSDADVEQYINEVSGQNGMSRQQFEQALSERGIAVARYREQASVEILKSRLAAQLRQSSSPVSSEEVDAYVVEHPEFAGGGARVTLARVTLNDAACSEVQEQLRGAGSFASIEDSCSSLKVDCLDLGDVASKDLSPDIAKRVSGLSPGELTPCAEGDKQIYLLIERTADSEDEIKSNREKAKQALLTEKRGEKISRYLSQELFKRHAVERYY